MEKINNQLQSAIKYLMSLAAFLVPIFFLPITLEKFEFNKLGLLVLITGISLILWTIDVIKKKEIKIAKTPFALPGLLFLTVVILSGIFSTDKTSSFFGRQGRWFPSLVSFGTLAAFYMVLTSNIREKKDVKMILYSFLTGTTLASLIGVLSYYSVEIIPQTGQNFNPTGSLMTLGILGAIACAAALYELIKGDSITLKIFAGTTFFVNFGYIALYNKPITWAIVVLGLGMVLLTTKMEELKEKKLELLSIGIVLTVIMGLILTPLTKPVIVKYAYPKSVQLPFRESWNISVSTMRDFPLLGTGPSTFYLNYPRYRSAGMNQTDYWNLRFDKPSNEILLIIGTLGILGMLSGAYFGIEIIKTSVNNLRSKDLKQLLALVTLLTLGSFLVTTVTVLSGFTLVLLLALFATLINEERQRYITFDTDRSNKESTVSLAATDENSAFLTVITVFPLLALAGFGFFSLYKMYPSEYYMQKAMETLNTDAGACFEYQAKAIQHNPKRSSYYNTYAQTNLAMGINLSQKENLNDTEKEALQSLISTAVRATKVNTENINSLDPLNWEIRADIYQAIRGATEDSDQWSLQALEAAMQLDPNNPQLRVATGGIFFVNEDYLSAANYFRQATNLKPDYANAYYNFAQAVKNLENYASAKRALELTLSLVPQDSPDYAQVETELSELESLIAATQPSEGTKPTVEDLTNKAEIQETGVTEQEPISIQGEEEEIIAPIDLEPESNPEPEND